VGTPGETTDLAAMARGAISVTPLKVDLTHEPTLRALRKVLP
jgi:5'-nucleotidase